MCPPISSRHRAKGMSCLYAAWLYQLVHGDQMKICFACFKAAVLALKNMLKMGDWIGPVPEGLRNSPVPDAWLGIGLTWVQSHGYLPPIVVQSGRWPQLMAPVSAWPGPQPVPTELSSKEAVSLDAGPKIAVCTQIPPWRLGVFSSCPHQCIMPPLSWWDIFQGLPHNGQPVLLELSPIWPMNLLAGTWLVNLKFVIVMGSTGTQCTLLRMFPHWAVSTPVKRWQVLLDPGELFMVHLWSVPEQWDLNRWRLSILEPSDVGVELVPADWGLRKRGFKVHSYMPWQDSTPEVWSWEPTQGLLIKDFESQRLLHLSLYHQFLNNESPLS
ncbi:testis-expressed protein 19.2-like [Mesocricetus auratus]|uniref:Testis-expressed protein 19.2-like n=1 Tax=Mesocricetus auratus TaxID=10036 RepID=A0ABM2XTX8_MESAU|nr:testis-expressed protein 19.2-like [Mesocricetus auratus]